MASEDGRDRPSYKRRSYLVEPGFQLKYTAILVVVGAAITALFGVMMFQAHVEAANLANLPATFGDAVNKSYQGHLLGMVVGIGAVMVVSLALFGVVITHRVAGPLFIMARYLEALGAGQFPELRPLRKGDELQAFFSALQQAVEQLRSRDADDLVAVDQALVQLERYCAATPEAAAQLTTALVSLKALRDRKRAAHEPEPEPAVARVA